jgi:signal transduction histidine kinase/CheY-like chemotaxis protein
MTINPQLLKAERHGQVGHIIRRDVRLLIDRWSARAIEEQPKAARLHREALQDDLPRLLSSISDALAESIGPDEDPHQEPAEAHGEHRWETGWSLPEVVKDYQILRLVIFDHLEQALGRQLSGREVQAIGLVLDEAIGASIAAYVRQRDEYTNRIEASLRARAAELSEGDRHKNEFLAVLAHELRNPLAPILNSMEVLRLLGSNDPKTAHARDIIDRQTRQLARLVDDLLDVTRIAQGKFELRRTTFDLKSAISQAVQTTAAFYQTQGHTLTTRVPDEPLTVLADQARVVQVVVNLLNNAAKYTDPGGKVELTAAREGAEVVVRLRDNGVGIEPEMLGKVFDLFTQVGRSMGRSHGGLGIGLMLVRRLVELQGGSVRARSDGPGKGSEFEFRLPVAVATPEAPPEAPPARKGEALDILIIEDHADARSALRQLLELSGHRVDLAANGPDGIARALTSHPRAVLIDLGLPEIDGWAVARRLREDLGPAVRLIAVTGHAQEEDRRRTEEAGFDAHLVKPVELADLMRALGQEPGA